MMHCDIKEPNIMLKTTNFHRPEVVLIDFGVSKTMVMTNSSLCGTPGYIPPETFDTGKWFPRGDVFSLGVVMPQVVCDKIPPTGMRTLQTPGGIFIEGCADMPQIQHATKTRRPPFNLFPNHMHGLSSLVQKLLEKQVRSRPSAPQALKDPWFKAVV